MEEEELQLRKNLQTLLNDRRLTVKALAQATNIPRATLSDWISTGSSPRSLMQVKRLAKYLGVSIEYLLFGDSEPDLGEAEQVILNGIYKIRLERVKETAAKP